MLMGLEDEQTVTAELRHEQKSKEVAITRLSIEVQTLTSGNKALAKDALHEKLAAAESKSKADTAKWATERQRLKDDVTRSQQKELQAKTERDAANEAINQVRTDQTFRCHLGLERPSTEVRQKSTLTTPGQQ